MNSRVVLVVRAFPKLSETFIISKFLGLLERGWDIHIVCAQSDQSAWGYFPALKDRSIRRHVHSTWPHQAKWLVVLLLPILLIRTLFNAPYSTFRYLIRGWKRFGPDVLRRFYMDAQIIGLKPGLIHFEFGSLAVERTYLKELLNMKITVSFRGYDLNYIGLETSNYYREVWDQADALHFLGEDLWQRAQQRGCLADKPHQLIPPAIDVEYFSPEKEMKGTTVMGTPERPLRILSVGRLEWKKGYEYALQAIKILIEEGVHCHHRILGGGDYLECLAFARHQLGLEDIVELVGPVPLSEVKAQMEWADIFLHSAVSEGFCNAVLEAQTMRLPVVCTDADGLRENVLDGVTGFVVPRRNPDRLADSMNILARNANLRREMGASGRGRIEVYFQLRDQIDSFEKFFLEAIFNQTAL